MFIRDIRVEGFGALKDRSIPLQGPVTVFYGPNEAGKSTLLHLIRTILFGFPARGQPSGRFEPIGGGAHGGTLTLEVPGEGKVLVSRYAAAEGTGPRGRAPSAGTVRITYGDGRTGGEEQLSLLLGGVTAEAFRSLFAFTLTELQELSTLTSGELGGFLYSAGLGIRASAVAETERRLTAELEARFRPRGKNQGIGRLLTEADRLDAEWRRSLAAAGRYNAMADELEKLTSDIASAETELSECRSGLHLLRGALQLNGKWAHRLSVSRKRDALETQLASRPPFPEGGVAMLEALLQQLERQITEEARLRREAEQLKERTAAFTGDDAVLLAERGLMDRLAEGLGVYRNGFVQEAEWSAEARRLEEQLESKLAELGLPSGTEAAGKLAVTVARQAEAKAWEQRSLELSDRQRRLMAERDGLQRSLAEAEEQVARHRSELEVLRGKRDKQFPGCTEEWLLLMPAVIRDLRRDYREADGLKQELRHLEERELEQRLQLEQLRAAAGGGTDNAGSLSQVGAIGWLSLAGGTMAGAWLAYRQAWSLAAAALLFLGGIGAALLWLSRSAARQNGAGGTRRGRRMPVPVQTEDQPLAARREELQARLAASRTRIKKRLTDAGLYQPYAAAALLSPAAGPFGIETGVPLWEDDSVPERLELWWSPLSELQKGLDRQEERLQEAERAAAHLKEQDGRVRKSLNRLEAEFAQMQEEWSDWLAHWGMNPGVPPEFAPDLLNRIGYVKELAARLERLQGQIGLLLTERSRFEAECRRLSGLEEAGAAAIPALLDRKKEELAAALERHSWKKDSESALQSLQPSLLEAGAALERTRLKLDALLKQAGAEDEGQFRRFGAEQEEYVRLQDELLALEEVLAAGVGRDRLPELDRILTNSGGQEALEEETALLEAQAALLAERLDQWKERKGQLAAECAKLVEGTEHGERRERQEELLSQFREEASHWAVYAMASGLLRKARETFERERQPAVLRRASAHFAGMTEGRYERVAAPLGEQRLTAIRPDGTAVDSSLLSRGTAEQLYLAIRFALAEELTSGPALPLIMDDIFVNFDRQRLSACVRELGILSERHQILVFTCHPHVVEAMETHLPHVQVVEV